MVLYRNNSALDTGHLSFVDLLAPAAICTAGVHILTEQHLFRLSLQTVELHRVVFRGGSDLGDWVFIAVNNLRGHGVFQLLLDGPAQVPRAVSPRVRLMG